MQQKKTYIAKNRLWIYFLFPTAPGYYSNEIKMIVRKQINHNIWIIFRARDSMNEAIALIVFMMNIWQ